MLCYEHKRHSCTERTEYWIWIYFASKISCIRSEAAGDYENSSGSNNEGHIASSDAILKCEWGRRV